VTVKIKKNKRPLIIAVVVFCILSITSYIYLDNIYKGKREYALNKSITNIENVYTSVLNSYSKLSSTIYNTVINKKEIIDILKDANSDNQKIKSMARDRLYMAIKDDYDYLTTISLRQLHFHLPNNDSFLRVHLPKMYGDNLTKVRYSVKLTNSTLKPVHGLEEGRVYNGFRYVYPIISEGIHLGSVEISISPKAIIRDIQKVLDSNISFFINANLVKKKVLDKRHYHVSMLNSNLLHEKHDKELENSNIYYLFKKINPLVSKRLAESKKFAIYKYNKIFTFIPISNVEGMPDAGYLVGATNSMVIDKMMTDNLILKIIALLSSIWISVLIYYFVRTFYRVKVLAHYDELTELMNRRSFKHHLDVEIHKKTKELSLVFIDIDFFKDINDTFGHAEGDKILKEFATLIRENTRKDDLVCRWGGEEFLILFKNTSLDDAIAISYKLRKLIKEYDFSVPRGITCSFGVTRYVKNEEIEQFISRADEILYKAKESGRDIVMSDVDL
jgi:diguanylate cyclase (GGDEF)-like protein